ncbi:MAG: acyl-CoA synthetase (AMP-forming)/AMP-acid ligase [Firmicutes bacterium]|nr:acyl-CoA synthetase (AMP-forming)/AMP-acid ligase [Bacillota bacterium]
MNIFDLVRQSEQRDPDRLAILAPGMTPLTVRELKTQVLETAGTLAGLGIRRGDRVSLVMPNGPEMASAFLAVTAVAACAPLNPAYSLEEFKFYLTDLNAKAVIIKDGLSTQAIPAAQALGLPILWLSADEQGKAGVFSLQHDGTLKDEPIDFARADETALVLHTSGTTGRPKIVPIAHSNITISAQNIAKSLALTAQDRCLNVMPLFHVHGLIGAVLSSLAAGSSVICTRGFDSTQFFGWLSELSPTWYTAVPTLHQAVLAQGKKCAPNTLRHSLRFIRSSSSPLSPETAKNIEELFSVPILEAYGMTEAAHQMAVNPLPPGQRKAGSVGKAAGCRIQIMGETGRFLEHGQNGEIVIQGENVISGYENNAKANQDSFRDGWFRTGDQGCLDADGYLFINGRTKEMINRGGEKIFPREIDELLLRHPKVQQAAAFAMPHPTLGEDLAAAVVLEGEEKISEKELRQYVAGQAAYFKVPARILFVERIPLGPTGKIQRVGLAEKLGLGIAIPPQDSLLQPNTPLEQMIQAAWAEVFDRQQIGRNDDFFALGGNSIQAMQIIARIRDYSKVNLLFTEFFTAPTIAELAELVESKL